MKEQLINLSTDTRKKLKKPFFSLTIKFNKIK